MTLKIESIKLMKQKNVIAEMRKRKTINKTLDKNIVAFYYFGNTLIFLSAAGGCVSIASFTTAIGAQVGIVRASFDLLLQ